MGKRGRPSLDAATKAARGTLRPSRERARGATTPQPVVQRGIARDFVALADAYVDDVISGRQVACQWVRKAAARFRRMKARAKARDCAYRFSPKHAQEVCAWISQLPHIEGRWSSATIKLEPWQIFLFVACYGFRRRVDGRRLVTNVYFQVARKSAKSTITAGAALYHMAVEREPGAQVVCGATTGQQARIVFGIMQRMVRRALWLRQLGFQAFANSITFDAIGGSAKPINSKSSTQDGLNPSFISLDESHAQTFELRDVLISAMGARPDGVIWCPTTAGYDMTSVGYALRSTAMKILDGVTESDHTFCVLYELDEQDDWRDEAVWVKSAPMIGVTPSLDYVRRYCSDAQQTQGMQGEFETKICNRWLHSAFAWIPMASWDRCEDKALMPQQFLRQRCWIGVDLAERDDIAAVALVFLKEGIVYAFVKGYLPADVVAERERAVPEYRIWVKTEDLKVTPGNLTDYPTIEADIEALAKLFDVQTIVIERYGALNMAANLLAKGLPVSVESKNAKVFTPPAKDFEARIKAQKFRHCGSTFLKWQASNVCVERRRDGSLLPTKDNAVSPNKIDAIDAILLGMSALVATPTAQPERFQMFFVGGGQAP